MLWSITKAMDPHAADIESRQKAYASWEKSNARRKYSRGTRCSSCRSLFSGCIGYIPSGYSRRQRCSILLAASPLGRSWDLLQTFLSIVACVFYVLETYDVTVSKVFDYVFTGFFTVDYVIRWYAAENRYKFPFGFHAVLDLATISPVYIELLSGDTGKSQFSFLRFVRILRAMRILRAFKVLNSNLSAVSRQALVLVLSVASIVFLSAGMFHLFEQELWNVFEGDDAIRPNGEVTYGDSLYFVLVTMATVGYGDITAESSAGKVVVSIMIVVALVVVPMQINRLTALITMQSKFRTRYKPSHLSHHVLVVGDVTNADLLRDFLVEFFHPDRMAEEKEVVILGPEEPPETVQSLLVNPLFDGKVQYVKGTVMFQEDLYRVAADEAQACFVLGIGRDPTASDKASALRTLMVKNFNPRIDTFLHIVHPSSISFMNRTEVTDVVCVEDWKYALLAQSCTTLGFCPLVLNLLRSVSAPAPERISEPWQREYLFGASFETYPVQCPAKLDGLTFLEAAYAIYEASRGRVFVWGLQENSYNRTDPIGQMKLQVLLDRSRRGSGPPSSLLYCTAPDNVLIPGDVILNPGPRYRVKAGQQLFVVAQSSTIANACMHDESYADLPFLPQPPPEKVRVYGWCQAPARFQHFPLWQSWEEDGVGSGDLASAMEETSTETALWRPHWEPHSQPSIEGPAPRSRGEGLQPSRSFDSDRNDSEDVATAGEQKQLKKTWSLSLAKWGTARKRSLLHRSPRVYSHFNRITSVLAASNVARRWVARVRRRLAARKAGAGKGAAAAGAFQTTDDPRVRSAVSGAISPLQEPLHEPPRSARAGSAAAPGLATGVGSSIVHDVRSLPVQLDGHIIVSGRVEGLDHFLTPLRSSHLLRTHLYRPVVILTPSIDPTARATQDLLEYDDVFLVRGQPDNIQDLERVSVSTASCFTVIADRDHVMKIDGQSLDANVIFSYLVLSQALMSVQTRPGFYVLVELSTVENMQAINNKHLNLQQYSVYSDPSKSKDPFGASRLGKHPFLFSPLPPPSGFVTLPARPSPSTRRALRSLAADPPDFHSSSSESKPIPVTPNPMQQLSRDQWEIPVTGGSHGGASPTVQVNVRVHSTSPTAAAGSPRAFFSDRGASNDATGDTGKRPRVSHSAEAKSHASPPQAPARVAQGTKQPDKRRNSSQHSSVTDRALAFEPRLPSDSATLSFLANYHYPEPIDTFPESALLQEDASLKLREATMLRSPSDTVISLAPGVEPGAAAERDPLPQAWYDERAFDPIPLQSSPDLLEKSSGSASCCRKKNKEDKARASIRAASRRFSAPMRAPTWSDLHAKSSENTVSKAKAMQQRREKKKQELTSTPGANHYEVNKMPFFAAGLGFATNSLHTILVQAYFHPNILRFIEALLSPAPAAAVGGKGPASRVIQLPVPQSYYGKPFSILFRDMLLLRGIIVVALYRSTDSLPFSPRHSFQYLMTGPPRNTAIRRDDLMMVLSWSPDPFFAASEVKAV